MAIVTGSEYDHVDFTQNNITTRHPLKDTTSREMVGDIVKIQDTEPQLEHNKIWIKETPGSEIQVPTYEEFTGLSDDIAQDYTGLTFPVVAGQHCRYNGGYYAAKQAITSSENWTAAHWQAITVGKEVQDLKSALFYPRNIIPTEHRILVKQDIMSGSYDTAGEPTVNNKRLRTKGLIPVSMNDQIDIKIGTKINQGTIALFNSSMSDLTETAFTSNKTITVSQDGYVVILFRNTSSTMTLTVNDFDAEVVFTSEIGKKFDAMNDDLYFHSTDTDDFYWRPEVRVNSSGSNYASSETHYTGLYKKQNTKLIVYPGSTIKAKTGYTMDYSVLVDGTKKQFARGVAAGNLIKIAFKGELLLSVTDGTSDSSTDALAKALAKAGLEIDLIVEPIKNRVEENTENIESLLSFESKAQRSLEYLDEFTEYIRGEIITTNVNVGTVVDVENREETSLMSCGIIECESGDKFILTGHSYNNPRLWAFTDEEYKLISKSESSITETNLQLTAPADGYLIINVVNADPHSLRKLVFNEYVADDVEDLKKRSERKNDGNLSNLVTAQKFISEDWGFAFINMYGYMGLETRHRIPGTKNIWSESRTTDLTQNEIWMSDGVHPFKGDGVTDMYARTIASQLLSVVPSYHDGIGATTPTIWAGRKLLWMGTSIPAGSDPEAGQGTGGTYPDLVAEILDATAINRAKGSSCVRINASTGEYTNMKFEHFLRALSRTIAECDILAANWDSIKGKIVNAPSTLTSDHVTIMKNHSFENILLPYLDGTNAMPDLFVIDHGANDIRPRGVDGESDLWITPTKEMIDSGVLAEDTYMTASNYANLKTALANDLSGITDLAEFSATLNRNCFKGAVNFIITLILRYNPYARIAIVSDYA